MKFLLFFISIICSLGCFAQIQISRNVFATTGMEMSSPLLQVSFTMGETFTATFIQGNTNTLGFQQNFESSLYVTENPGTNLSLYPNPANDHLFVTVAFNTSYAYRIYDVTGRVIRFKNHQIGDAYINVASLVEGKYFVEFMPTNGQNIHLPFIIIH